MITNTCSLPQGTMPKRSWRYRPVANKAVDVSTGQGISLFLFLTLEAMLYMALPDAEEAGSYGTMSEPWPVVTFSTLTHW